MSSNRKRACCAGLLTLGLIAATTSWTRSGATAETLFATADASFRAGRLDHAELALGGLEKRRPPVPVDRLLRGQVACGLDRSDEAVAELAEVPDPHPLAPIA